MPTTPGLLSVTDVLSAADIERDTVDVPEWGGSVRVRGLGQAEKMRVAAALRSDATDGFPIEHVDDDGNVTRSMVPADFYVQLLIMACEDADGNPLFTPDVAEQLGRKASAPIERVAQRILELSGMTGDDEAGKA